MPPTTGTTLSAVRASHRANTGAEPDESGRRVTERQLIARILTGDGAAERELYDAHVDRLYRLAYRMTGNDDLARDCTQEAFIRAFEGLRGFRGEAALSTWLHSITVSVVLSALRRRKRHEAREVPLDQAAERGDRDPAGDPRLRDRLHQAIEGLPETLRMVFVMHELEGYTHEEIGDALEVAPGTSKARLFHARAKLREALADLAPEGAK